MWVWPNAIPDPKRVILRERSGFVCAARFHPSKGLDVLCDAAAKISEKVTIIGPGTEPIGGIGRLEWDQVLQRMATARAVVVPSRSEAFGLVAIEALSVGTPVVASAVGGLPEIVRHGVDGFLVPPGDSDALADALRQVKAQMQDAARQGFLERFCIDNGILCERVSSLTSL
jgi:glycosyltransferase involved in cell wall biosynthesis